MTEPDCNRPPGTPADRAGWIRAIAADLAATGVATCTNGNHLSGLDVTATACSPGRSTAEIMLDEDGYAEVRWLTDLTAPPADVAAGMIRVLTAVTTAPPILAPDKAQR